MQNKNKKKKGVNDTITEQVVEESASKVSVDAEKQQNVQEMVQAYFPDQSPIYVKNLPDHSELTDVDKRIK